MVVEQGPRAQWVDLRGIRRLAERAVTGARIPPEELWGDPVRPVLQRHWVLAEHEWHRRRAWVDGTGQHEETHAAFTRYALLPDARLVRADRRLTEVLEPAGPRSGPEEQEVRPLADRDIRTLDRRSLRFTTERAGTTTWGVQPDGEPFLPWPGAGIETMLRALVR